MESKTPSEQPADLRRGRRFVRAWTAQEVAILRKNAGKLEASDIGNLLGRSAQSVQAKAWGMGLPLFRCGQRHQASKYPDSLVETARKMREQGWMIERIARELRVPFSTVKGWVNFERRTNDPVKLR